MKNGKRVQDTDPKNRTNEGSRAAYLFFLFLFLPFFAFFFFFLATLFLPCRDIHTSNYKSSEHRILLRF